MIFINWYYKIIYVGGPFYENSSSIHAEKHNTSTFLKNLEELFQP